MNNAKNELGNKYGKLAVVARAQITTNKNGCLMWDCVCDCGNTRVISGASLRSGNAISCKSCGSKRKRIPNPTGGKNLKNEIGNRYGKLVVVSYAGTRANGRGGSVWKCKCDCGNETIVWSGSLRRGSTKSCGCLRSETVRATRSTQKGLSGTKEYRSWKGMIARCYVNGNARDQRNYLERGITVCDRWKNSFQTFLEDMGKCPGKEYSLDRVNNNGSYSKENCRWATRIDQMNNKRSNVVITYNGSVFTLAQLERELHLPPKSLSKKLSYYHGDLEKAVKAAEKSARRNVL